MVEIQDLNVIFNKNTSLEKVVFSSFSLTIHDGDFICVLGTNGSGKTTLFNALIGRIPYNGKILLNGKDISKYKTYKRSKEIGIVYQDPLLGTAPNLTVEENLLLAKKESSIFFYHDKKKYLSKCKEYLKKFELKLEDNFKTPIQELSGGMRQALTLFMATNKDPKVLLLDEHVAALNPTTAEKVMHITNEIIQEKKMETLMITHNIDVALKYGNRLIILDEGKVVFDVSGKEKEELTREVLLSKNYHHFSDSTVLS